MFTSSCPPSHGLSSLPLSSSSSSTVKVVSFNIRNGAAFTDGRNRWSKRRAMVLSVIVEQRPDFVGIQEALDPQITYLGKELPAYHLYSGRPRFAFPCPLLNEHVPIIYDSTRWRMDEAENGTFWLSKNPNIPGSTGFGNWIPRIVTWARFHELNNEGSSSVYVYNTHFGLFATTKNSGRQSAELLAKYVAKRKHSEDPVIVTGDFNCTQDDDPIRYLTGKDGHIRLVDTYRHYMQLPDNNNNIVRQSLLEGTFHGWSGKTNGPRIDYIFVNEGIQILDAVILHNEPGNKGTTSKRFPSDHYPVMAHVEIPVRFI